MRGTAWVVAAAWFVTALGTAGEPETSPAPTPTNWTWLKPGQTRREDVDSRAAKPLRSFRLRIVRGEIDLRLAEPGPLDVGAARERRERVEVEVVAYESAHRTLPDRLVFLRDRLLYAVVATRESERTAEALRSAFGAEGRTLQVKVPRALSYTPHEVLVFDAPRLAFARLAAREPGPFALRIAWAAPDAAWPEAGTVEWRFAGDTRASGDGGKEPGDDGDAAKEK